MSAEHAIRTAFEGQWNLEHLESQVAACPRYDIFPLMQRHVSQGMRILEAGCGMGRWLFFYQRQGFDITGMDWSEKTVESVKAYDTQIRIIQGDIRATAFADGEFDLVLSLGAVEHDINGPEQALAEFARVLKNNGLLICTVPVVTGVRQIMEAPKTLYRHLKSIVLALTGSGRGTGLARLSTVKRRCRAEWSVVPGLNEAGYYFFEYRFSLAQVRTLIQRAGFVVIDLVMAFPDDGLFHDLGRLVGRWDFSRGRPIFNPLGRWLRKVFPRTFYHMAVCVARKG